MCNFIFGVQKRAFAILKLQEPNILYMEFKRLIKVYCLCIVSLNLALVGEVVAQTSLEVRCDSVFLNYIVQKGDYVNKIAGMFEVSKVSILHNNEQIENPNVIKAGDNINIVKRIQPCNHREEILSLVKEIKDTVFKIKRESIETKPPTKSLLQSIATVEFGFGVSVGLSVTLFHFARSERRRKRKLRKSLEEEGGS
jgi:LysM repeat protein